MSYARRLANAVHERFRHVARWAANYYNKRISYYPVPQHRMLLSMMPVLSHLKPTNPLSHVQQETMNIWAKIHGKSVRQSTVRQEMTKFKSGALPFNMYERNEPRNNVPVVFNQVPALL